MSVLILRSVYCVLVLLLAWFSISELPNVIIHTDLNDINLSKQDDKTFESASNVMAEAISSQLLFVVTHENQRLVDKASEVLKQRLNTIDNLVAYQQNDIQESLTSLLKVHRFSLLNEEQRKSLSTLNAEQIGDEAYRKLFQLGEGVRIFPFEDDPLGWHTEFLLSRWSQFTDTPPSVEKEQDSPLSFSVLNVKLIKLPQGMDEQNRLFIQLEQVRNAIEKDFSLHILNSGIFYFVVDSAQSSKADIQRIAIGSVVGVLLLMILVFRSLLPLTLSLLSIAIGIGFGLFASVKVFGSIHILTVVFGASLIGIVIDYSLHYFYHHLSEIDSSADSKKQAQDKALIRAMVLSMLTSFVGYGALGMSDLLVLKKVALFSCVGLFMAWLSVIVLGPLIALRQLSARQQVLLRIINLIQVPLARHSRLTTTTGCIFAIVAGVYLISIPLSVNDDPRKFFHVSNSLLEQEQSVAQLTGLFEPGKYFIAEGTSKGEVYNTIQQFYDELSEQQLVQYVSSVINWLPSPEQQTQNYSLQEKLYGDDGAVKFLMRKLGADDSTEASQLAYQNMADKPLSFESMREYIPILPPLIIEMENRVFGFVLIRKNAPVEKLVDLSKTINSVVYINSLGAAKQALAEQRSVGTKLLFLAYGMLAIGLLVYYRKLTAVSVLLIPISASTITLVSLSLIGQAITVFHIMALFLVLGLGMDYIVFANEMRHKKETTQQAILLSAITSLLSFGLLAFSAMPIVSAFGSTLLIGNTINFIASMALFTAQKTTTEKKEGIHV